MSSCSFLNVCRLIDMAFELLGVVLLLIPIHTGYYNDKDKTLIIPKGTLQELHENEYGNIILDKYDKDEEQMWEGLDAMLFRNMGSDRISFRKGMGKR